MLPPVFKKLPDYAVAVKIVMMSGNRKVAPEKSLYSSEPDRDQSTDKLMQSTLSYLEFAENSKNHSEYLYTLRLPRHLQPFSYYPSGRK
jgi:hypothetical protein